MLKRTHNRLLAALTGALLATACGASQPVSTTDSQLPGNPGEVPMLGMGFDATTGKLTGLRCFDGGSIEPTHAKSASVTVSRDMGFDDLQRLMAGKIGISVPIYPGINANGSAGFAAEYAKTDYSDTFTVALEASAGSKRLYIPDALSPDLKLSEPAQRLKATSASLRDSCGTDYVSYAEFGVSMVAVLKVEYANEYDKKAFSGSVGVEVLGGVASGSLDIGVENLKSSARARTTLMIHQRGGDPTDLLKVVATASNPQEEPLGGFFLQCDFANRQHCVDVFKAVLKHANDIAASVHDDGGYQIKNAMPLYFETQAYQTSGALRDLSVAGPEPLDPAVLKEVASRLEAYRKRIVAVKGRAIADQTRVADLRAKLAVDLSNQTLGTRLAAIEAGATAAEAAANAAQAACDAKATVLTVDATLPCRDATAQAEAALSYDRGALSVMPQTFYSWCILAHSDLVINVEDKLAAVALMKLVGVDPLDVSAPTTTGDALSATCLNAQAKLAQLQTLSLDFDADDPVHALPLASLRVLASFPQVKAVSAKNQFLVVTDGLRDLPALASLDLSGNYFRSLSAFRGFAASAPLETLRLARNQIASLFDATDKDQTTPLLWKTLDLSDNQLTVFNDPRLKAPSLAHLDLSKNALTDAQGLLTLPALHDADLRQTGLATCPLANAAVCDLGN